MVRTVLSMVVAAISLLLAVSGVRAEENLFPLNYITELRGTFCDTSEQAIKIVQAYHEGGLLASQRKAEEINKRVARETNRKVLHACSSVGFVVVGIRIVSPDGLPKNNMLGPTIVQVLVFRYNTREAKEQYAITFRKVVPYKEYEQLQKGEPS